MQKQKQWTMLDELKKYFDETPREKILKDWQEVEKECSNIESPLISDFIEQSFHYHFNIPDKWYKEESYNFNNNIKNPSSSRIFLYLIIL